MNKYVDIAQLRAYNEPITYDRGNAPADSEGE